MQLFLEFTSIVILATVISIILRFFKQPLVVGYIITGILMGPRLLNIAHSTDYIDLFSTMGITILLFIVGLNLRPSVIREVGKVSFIGGLAQIAITALFGFIISMITGMSYLHAFYVGVALSFSSTIIILKLLSDKGDLPKLYGKVTVGFLLVQDLVAIIVLLSLSTFSSSHGVDMTQAIVLLFAKLLTVGILIYLISKYLFSYAIHHLAESQELLFLFSIAWGLGLASIFYLIGFSEEVGALIAGVSLSTTPFADGIASRLKPLRDFFLILFFIFLGSKMVITGDSHIFLITVLLSVFVLVVKPLIVFLLMNVLGYTTKQSYQTGVSLAQVSEFSLILAALGVSLGHLDNATVSLITLVGLVSIAGSSYMILYSDKLYPYFEALLKKIELRKTNKTIRNMGSHYDLLLFGFDRVGRDFIEAFEKLGKKYAVIDYNPHMIKQLEISRVPFKYGDVEDPEFLQELQLDKVKLCVSTIPSAIANMLLIKEIRKKNLHAIIIVRALEMYEAKKLYEEGATYVLMPHYLGAKYATSMIKRIGLDVKGFIEERERHLSYVNKKEIF